MVYVIHLIEWVCLGNHINFILVSKIYAHYMFLNTDMAGKTYFNVELIGLG